jgi:hypothetical protein
MKGKNWEWNWRVQAVGTQEMGMAGRSTMWENFITPQFVKGLIFTYFSSTFLYII